MKRALILLLVSAACRQSGTLSATKSSAGSVRTLESVDARPAVIDPPPMLTEEAAAPKPRDPLAAQNQIPLTEADEQLRAKLPFAPAIAMDPVDGSKISIRATTPTFELKGKIYYFTSEENRRTFVANPDQYTKGLFSHL